MLDYRTLLQIFTWFFPKRARRSVPLRIWLAAGLAAAGFLALPEIVFEAQQRIGIVQRAERGDAKAAQISGVASIIDGDTLEIHGTRIRLHAVDAPETRQTCYTKSSKPYRCGVEASRALDEFVGRATVTCERKQTDRYGRMVARCRARGVDLGEWLVRNGHGVAYRAYGKAYVAAEDEARLAKRGIWAGKFDMPWDWRKNK